MTIYYKRLRTDPVTMKYNKLVGVYRFVRGLNPERWDGVNWEDYPPLFDASGINGDHDYHIISEKEAAILMKQVTDNNLTREE